MTVGVVADMTQDQIPQRDMTNNNSKSAGISINPTTMTIAGGLKLGGKRAQKEFVAQESTLNTKAASNAEPELQIPPTTTTVQDSTKTSSSSFVDKNLTSTTRHMDEGAKNGSLKRARTKTTVSIAPTAKSRTPKPTIAARRQPSPRRSPSANPRTSDKGPNKTTAPTSRKRVTPKTSVNKTEKAPVVDVEVFNETEEGDEGSNQQAPVDANSAGLSNP